MPSRSRQFEVGLDQFVHQYNTTDCLQRLSQHLKRKLKNAPLLVDVVNAAADSEAERARVLQRLPYLRSLVSLLRDSANAPP
jgi:hypothetical protein